MDAAATVLPELTRDRFFAWAQQQHERHEFDGLRPVAMTGGNARHTLMCRNLLLALWTRLQGGACTPLGPDAGIATTGDAVRYPDALVTCARFADGDLVIPGVVVVFEVLSPSSGRVDRIVKVREYRAVPSIRRYVIVEHRSRGATILARSAADLDWTATTATAGESIDLPEIGIAFPLDAIYAGTELA